MNCSSTNGRLNILEPPMNQFSLYDKIPSSNQCETFHDAMTGNFTDSTLSKIYFSKENIEIIQNGLRAGVYHKSGEKKIIIPPQNIDVLKQIMRHMFIQYSVFQPYRITEQIERLNNIVLDYTVPKVFGESIGYLKYLEDASRLVVPIELPVQTDRVYKQLELKPFM